MAELPTNIIFEILTRIPSLKTLDRCKLVCKEWRDLIYESSFMSTYSKRTKKVHGYFVQSNTDNEFVSFDQSDDIKKMAHTTRILASCNQGILCCFKTTNNQHYLYKPTTQQWQILPRTKNGMATFSAAITILRCGNYLHCKIFRLSQYDILPRSMRVSYACEIFNSKSWTWSTQDGIILPKGAHIISTNPAVSANNYIHWLTDHDYVIAFHRTINSSRCQFKLPESVYKNESYKCKQLSSEYQCRLGFTCLTQQGNNMGLWVLEDMINEKCAWIKMMTINLDNIEKTVKNPCPIGLYYADIAFMKAYDEVVFYNVRDCSYNTMKMEGSSNGTTNCFQFRSDFESVNLLDPRSGRATEIIERIGDLIQGVFVCFAIFGPCFGLH